jgi:hypothetical protein
LNKFGAPPGYLTRTGDYYSIHQMWWIDPEKEAQLQNAMRNSSMKLPVGPTDDRYWPEYDKKEASTHP